MADQERSDFYAVLPGAFACMNNSWLTVSSQIVKSLLLCYKKSYFFNMVQPIDLIFCKVIEMIEENILIVQIFHLDPNFLFLDRSIFSADDVTRIKSGNPI